MFSGVSSCPGGCTGAAEPWGAGSRSRLPHDQCSREHSWDGVVSETLSSCVID